MDNVAVAPANQVTTNDYAAVVGSQFDTAVRRSTSLAFHVEEVGDANGVTVKIEASVDGETYVDLVAYDETGTAHGAAGVAIAGGAADWLLLGPAAANGAKSAFRYYRVAVKSTVGDSHGTVQVRGFAK